MIWLTMPMAMPLASCLLYTSPLKAEGLLLVDSGGQYTDGTTDITRTIALGPLTEEMKRHYTLVLRLSLIHIW